MNYSISDTNTLGNHETRLVPITKSPVDIFLWVLYVIHAFSFPPFLLSVAAEQQGSAVCL